MKQCTKCKEEKNLESFKKDRRIKSGYGAICKTCHCEHNKQYNIRAGLAKGRRKKWSSAMQRKRYHRNAYKAAKSKRTPKWAKLDEIERIYDACPEGYQVDHIIPLRGKVVSGLHIESNLQYLTARENYLKRNNYGVN